jgi:hypothetical protein
MQKLDNRRLYNEPSAVVGSFTPDSPGLSVTSLSVSLRGKISQNLYAEFPWFIAEKRHLVKLF